MTLIESIIARAKSNKQRIVLPESLEERTLTAADQSLADEIADIILIGNPDEIFALADKLGELMTDKSQGPVFICHGDGYYVKMGLLPLRKACMEMKVDIALFGHTHRQYYEYYDGIYTFNPGSVMPSANPYSCYGILDLSNPKPLFYHREI